MFKHQDWHTNMSDYHPLEVVCSEAQIQVDENLGKITCREKGLIFLHYKDFTIHDTDKDITINDTDVSDSVITKLVAHLKLSSELIEWLVDDDIMVLPSILIVSNITSRKPLTGNKEFKYILIFNFNVYFV